MSEIAHIHRRDGSQHYRRLRARHCRQLATTAAARGVDHVVDEVEAPGTGKGFDHVDRWHAICAVTQIETAQLAITRDQKNDIVLLIDYRSIVHRVRAQPGSRPDWGSGI